MWRPPPHQGHQGGAPGHTASGQARESFAAGDYRWVAEVVDHVLFADPSNADARTLQAAALEQLGYGSENGTWRNAYLMGALELRDGGVGTPTATTSPDVLAALTLDQLFDSLAIRIDGPNSWDASLAIRWNINGHDEPTTLRLHNGVLTHIAGEGPAVAAPGVTITLDEADLRVVLLGTADLEKLAADGRAETSGDPKVIAELLGHLTDPDPDFAMVTP
ncbi:alkyl sulfatase C-terminal domain-containing protein [Streptomyces sp. NPDC058874]|uniref:alkyl sulfatase C-terminal domain-containing protein n=1 Tax=unclassified Streptomyces TaxID=2593676 RepID=UPI00369CEC05